MSVQVKICGVTEVRDAEAIARAGADFIGLNFWPGSRRHISWVRAHDVVDAARAIAPDIAVVGVFVNQSHLEIDHYVDALELDYVQFHGDEEPTLVGEYGDAAIKAVRVGSERDAARAAEFPCHRLLVDAPCAGFGGSGETFDWGLLSALRDTGKEVFLAGGLNPMNVAEAVVRTHPFAVDVASGVELRPGVKDIDLVRRFIDGAKGAA